MLKKRSTYFVAIAIALAFLVGVRSGIYLAEPVERSIPPEYFEQDSLLTWHGWSGDLCFLLKPMIHNGRAEHDFWSKWQGQCGVAKLKEALLAVPKSHLVLWHEWPPKFEYPDVATQREVFAFAAANGIVIEKRPVLQ